MQSGIGTAIEKCAYLVLDRLSSKPLQMAKTHRKRPKARNLFISVEGVEPKPNAAVARVEKPTL